MNARDYKLRHGELAEALGIPKSQAFQLIQTGVIPSIREEANGLRLVSLGSVEAFIERQQDELAKSALRTHLDVWLSSRTEAAATPSERES